MNTEAKSMTRDAISPSDDKIIRIRSGPYKMNVIITLFKELFYLGEVTLRAHRVFQKHLGL
ncbi:MAG: hypothetical protein DHS20C07_04220 [Methyloligella sp.]|nr:MAG: hypothetical protein DHS20C07_04220 [Methyloligella sp.]